MKTKTRFAWDVLCFSLGCFLCMLHSSHGMFGEGFDPKKVAEEARAKAQQQAEQQQRERERAAEANQGNRSEAVERGVLGSGRGPSEEAFEETSTDQAARIIIGIYFPSLSEEEKSSLLSEINGELSTNQELYARRNQAFGEETKIFLIADTLAKKAGVIPPSNVAEAVAAYQEAGGELLDQQNQPGLQAARPQVASTVAEKALSAPPPQESAFERQKQVRLQNFQAQIAAAEKELAIHQATKDKLQGEHNDHKQAVDCAQAAVDQFKSGKLLYNLSPQLAELRRNRDNALSAKTEFVKRTNAEFDGAKRSIATLEARIASLKQERDNVQASVDPAVVGLRRQEAAALAHEQQQAAQKASTPSLPIATPLTASFSDSLPLAAAKIVEETIVSRSLGSTSSESGEDSHKTTPEKALPSAPPLPLFTEVERLQEEARQAKAEMDLVEEVRRTIEPPIDAAYEALRNACQRIFGKKNWYEYLANTVNLNKVLKGETVSLTPKEQEIFPFYQETRRLNAIKREHSKERLEAARNRYLAAHEQLKNIHPSPEGKLASIQALIDFIIPIRKVRFYEMAKEPWNRYYSLVKERYQIRQSVASSTPYLPSQEERRELASLQEQHAAAQAELATHEATKADLEAQLKDHERRETQTSEQLETFQKNNPFTASGFRFGMTEHSRQLLDQKEKLSLAYNAAIQAKREFIATLGPQLKAAKKAIADLLPRVEELRLQSDHLAKNITIHPEQRLTRAEVAYLNPTTFKERFEYYLRTIEEVAQYCWKAHKAAESFASSYGDIPRYGPHGGEKKYWAPIYEEEAAQAIRKAVPLAQELAKIRFSLFAPQEQQAEQRRLDSLSRSQRDKEILYAIEKEESYQEGVPLERFGWAQVRESVLRDKAKYEAWMRARYAENGLSYDLPTTSSQGAIQRNYDFSRQQQNAMWNAQQNAMFYNSMNNGTYCPLPMYRR